MNMNTGTVLESSAQRLFPNLSLEQVLAELMLGRVQKNLIKYKTMARQFEAKYKQDFDSFRQEVLDIEPDYEVEKDYFDWELAVTGISDMKKEITRLQMLEKSL